MTHEFPIALLDNKAIGKTLIRNFEQLTIDRNFA